jgi:hypothetical protein
MHQCSIKPRFDPSIILLYITVSVEQSCDITHVDALPENEGILEAGESATAWNQIRHPAVRLQHALGESLACRHATATTMEDLVPTTNQISDKGIAVFAFAAYHQLEGGHPVREVIVSDRTGHSANPEAIRELEELGLLTRDGNRVSFTDQGEAMLDNVIKSMQQAAGGQTTASA